MATRLELLAASGAHWLTGSLERLKDSIALNMLRYVEIVAIVVSICVDFTHLTHLTWWGLISLAIYDMFVILDTTKSHSLNGYHYWGAALTFSVVILIGVLGLSLAQCSMLSDAVDQYGWSGYVVGNFLVHYYPTLRILADEPHDPKDRLKLHDFIAQASFGITPVIVYISWAQTSHVYGCFMSENNVRCATSVLLPILSVLCWRQHVRSKT
jgi:hypothetical protein